MSEAGQPRVRRNEWRTLVPATLGRWTPSLSVCVVIPAHNAQATLPLTLASLAGQTYPDELLEVIVVDDGSDPGLELPELRPTRTRLVHTLQSWGPGHACTVGIEAAEADVILRLDADMVIYRDHVEAQMRWHHLIDYAVVQGHKMFVDPAARAGGLPSPVEVAAATANGETADLFAGLSATRHEWVEAFYDRTDDLHAAGPAAWTVHVGATGSMPRALYHASGGMDPTLKMGEDTEIGYRLSQIGAVFVPDREAKSWHLGPSTAMQRAKEVYRHNWPFLTDRIPQLRDRRRTPGRQYSVPYVHAVVDVSSATWEEAHATIDGLLSNVDVDLVCSCIGPWDLLDDARRSSLSEPLRDLRMIAGTYRGERRVQMLEEAPSSVFPASFRLDVGAGWRPGEGSLASLLKRMESDALGRMSVLMPDGTTAKLERSAATARVDRLAGVGENRDDLFDELYGNWWSDGADVGFEWWEQPLPPSVVAAQTELARIRRELVAATKQLAALESASKASAIVSATPSSYEPQLSRWSRLGDRGMKSRTSGK